MSQFERNTTASKPSKRAAGSFQARRCAGGTAPLQRARHEDVALRDGGQVAQVTKTRAAPASASPEPRPGLGGEQAADDGDFGIRAAADRAGDGEQQEGQGRGRLTGTRAPSGDCARFSRMRAR